MPGSPRLPDGSTHGRFARLTMCQRGNPRCLTFNVLKPLAPEDVTPDPPLAPRPPGGLAEMQGGAPGELCPPQKPPHPPPALTVNDEPVAPALAGQAEGLLQLHLGGHRAGVTWAARHTAEAPAGPRPSGPHNGGRSPRAEGARPLRPGPCPAPRRSPGASMLLRSVPPEGEALALHRGRGARTA